MSYSNYQLNQKINNLQQQINNIPPPSGDQDLTSVLTIGNNAGGLSITNLNDLGVSTINGSVYPPVIPTDTLTSVLIAGNSAGASNINMNNNDILNVDNINLTTINNSVYPPVIPTDTLTSVLIAGNSAGASDINMNNNDILNVDNINLTTINNSAYPPVIPTDTLQNVLIAGNTATGTSASISLTNLPKQTVISPTSVFLNDTTIVQQATLNTQKLRLLTSGLTNDITSDKISIIKPATSSISEYGTDGISLSGLFGAESRSGGFNLNSGINITNTTTKLSGTLNEAFVSLDGNTTSSVLGNKSTLNATGLTCVNKVTPSTTSSLSATALNLGITGTTLTVSPTGLSSTNILNLNSSSQIDINCPVRVRANPATTESATLTSGQLSMKNTNNTLQNNISSTSQAITNGTKTITMTVDGISSTGAMSLGTATVNLTTSSTAIKQPPLTNSSTIATTSYVDTAISAIPPSTTPTLQSVINQGNTITNGIKTLTLNVNGIDSTGDIVINNDIGNTRIKGTTTIDTIKSSNYDAFDPNLTIKLGNSLTTGSLELGNNMTTGNINFGSKLTTGNLYIMNEAISTGNITMLNPSATGKLIVRGEGIQTDTITSTLEVKSLKYNALNVSQDLDIGANVTNKLISIGRAMTAGSIINIGTTSSEINLLGINSKAYTQTTGDNTDLIATTKFVNASILATPPSASSLSAVLAVGNSAGLNDINMNSRNITNVNNISVSTINSTSYPPAIPSLQAVINVNDDLQGATPTNNQVIKYNGTNVIWSDLPAPPATSTLQDVLNAGNTANETIILSKLGITNDIRPNKINIRNDAGTEESNLTKDSLIFTTTAGTNNSFSSSGAVLAGFVTEQLRNCSMTVEGGFFNQNTSNLKESNLKDDILYLLDDTNKTNRTISLSNGFLQEINNDNIALGTKSLLSDSTLTLINKETSEITTIIPSSSTITDGTNTSVVNNSGLGIVEPFTNKSTYYNLNDFLISKTVGTVSTSSGSSSEILSLGRSDSVLLTSSTNELTALGATITDGTYINALSSSEINISNGTNQSLLTNTALSFTLPNDVFAIDATDFSLSNTGGTISNLQTKSSIQLNNPTNSITFNPSSFIYNTATTNWSDIATSSDLTLYAPLAGTNIFTGTSNTFRNSLIVKASPIATIFNTISNNGSSIEDLNKSSYYNLDGYQNFKTVGPITNSNGGTSEFIGLNFQNSALLTSNYLELAPDHIYLSDQTTNTNTLSVNDIQISDGILKTTYNNNSIVSTNNLTINSAPTKLLKIGSGSATENVEIASQAGRSVVLHLGDGINNIAGSGVHINNGTNSVGNTQINNGSGQTGTINIGNATSGTTTTNIVGTTNIGNSGTTTTTVGIQSSTINIRGQVNINTNGTGGFSNTSIGLNGSTTSINGTTNINTSGGGGTTIGTDASGTNTIRGATVNVSGTTNNITGITNVNTTGNASTVIGGTGTGAITIGTGTTSTVIIDSNTNTDIDSNGQINIGNTSGTATAITIGNDTNLTTTNLLGSQVNITNPKINQPITINYNSILPATGTAGLNQIGGRAVYYNNGGGAGAGTGFFTTTGTTKQVYAFFNSVPTGRYLVSALLQCKASVVSTSIDMKTVYNTSTSPSFPQPLTLNQSLTIADTTQSGTFSNNVLDYTTTKATSQRFTPFQSAVIDISPTIGNQIGLAITFGTATVGVSGDFSLFLNFTILRIS